METIGETHTGEFIKKFGNGYFATFVVTEEGRVECSRIDSPQSSREGETPEEVIGADALTRAKREAERYFHRKNTGKGRNPSNALEEPPGGIDPLLLSRASLFNRWLGRNGLLKSRDKSNYLTTTLEDRADTFLNQMNLKSEMLPSQLVQSLRALWSANAKKSRQEEKDRLALMLKNPETLRNIRLKKGGELLKKREQEAKEKLTENQLSFL